MSIPSPDLGRPAPIASSNVEAVVHSRLAGEHLSSRTLTPDKLRALALGTELAAKYNPDDPDASLFRPEGPRNLSQIDTTREIDRRIRPASEITEDTTGARRTEQTELRTSALQVAVDAKAIAERGLEGIPADRRDAYVQDLVETILDVIPAYSSLSLAEKKLIIKNLLNNPKARVAIGEHLTRILDPNADVSGDTTPLVTARETHDVANKEVARASKEFVTLEAEIGHLETAQREHSSIDSDTGKPGTKFQEIQILQASIDYVRINTLRESLQKTYGGNFENAKQLVREKLKNGVPITSSYEKELGELVQMEDKLQRFEELRAERDGLPDKLTQKQKERKKLKRQKRDKETANNDAGEDLTEAEAAKAKKEKAFTKSVTSAVSDALSDYLFEDDTARLAMQKSIMAEKIRLAQTEDEKRILAAIDARWVEEADVWGIRGKKKVTRIKAEQQKHDWQRTLTGGKDRVQANILAIAKDDLIPLSTDSPTELAIKQAERDRLDRRFAEEPEFRDRMTRAYTSRLIANQRLVGRVSDEEIRLLDKGGLKDAMDTVIREDPAIRQRAAEELGQSEGDSPIDNAKKKHGADWAKAIMTLLALGGAAATTITG